MNAGRGAALVRGGWVLAACLVGLVCLAACGEGAPSKGSYSLVFPSVAAAVAADSVRVLVFDAPADKHATLCADLLQLQKTRGLPKALVEGAPTRVCDAQSGTGAELAVGYGDRAFLAVASRQGADFLVGCAIENVGAGDAPAKVFLAPASTKVIVPPTTCTTLSDACSGRCK